MGKILKNTKFALLENMAQEIAEGVETYYVFASNPEPWVDDNTPPATFESVSDSIFETQQKMLFGKRLKVNDGRFLTKRYGWVSDKVYTQYEDTDPNIFDKNFYVITDENKVYKCLYNKNGALSKIKPTLTQTAAFTTSDGYRWKYMFSVTPSDMNRFSTVDYIPVTPDATVISAAQSGLDVIEIINGGANYRTFVKGSIQAQANTSVFQIDNYASPDNDFYRDSAFYVESGPAAGALRVISSYESNSSGNWVTVANAIPGIVPSLSKYSIAPHVFIRGDGNGAIAVAEVSNSYSISTVTILATGNGYSRATATIVANTAFGSGANLVVRIPPPGGHGSNPYYELGADAFGVSVQFANNEGSTIQTESEFRRYGLLKNPKYRTSASRYDANTFSQVFKCQVSPQTVFDKNEIVNGDTSGARGVVIHSNTSVLMMVGDKTFANSESITSETGKHASISTILSYGDIDQSSSTILYINNTTPIERANTETETVQLIVQL